jgi:hypothetical protein
MLPDTLRDGLIAPFVHRRGLTTGDLYLATRGLHALSCFSTKLIIHLNFGIYRLANGNIRMTRSSLFRPPSMPRLPWTCVLHPLERGQSTSLS